MSDQERTTRKQAAEHAGSGPVVEFPDKFAGFVAQISAPSRRGSAPQGESPIVEASMGGWILAPQRRSKK